MGERRSKGRGKRRGTSRASRVVLEPPKPAPEDKLPPRTIDQVTDDELLEAILGQATLSAQAFVLRVDVKDLVRRLARKETSQMLRDARAAADAVRATRLALAMPFAAAELEALATSSGPTDSVKLAACQAVLTHGAAVRKADLAESPDDKSGWKKPGAYPIRLVQGGKAESRRVGPDSEAPPAPPPSDDEKGAA